VGSAEEEAPALTEKAKENLQESGSQLKEKTEGLTDLLKKGAG